MSRANVQAINKPRTNHGASSLFARGGDVMESKMQAKKELSFMRSKGAPKTMVRHEESEMAKGYAKGGFVRSADGVASKGKTKARQVSMACGGKVKK